MSFCHVTARFLAWFLGFIAGFSGPSLTDRILAGARTPRCASLALPLGPSYSSKHSLQLCIKTLFVIGRRILGHVAACWGIYVAPRPSDS